MVLRYSLACEEKPKNSVQKGLAVSKTDNWKQNSLIS